jgi:hypothetical protein
MVMACSMHGVRGKHIVYWLENKNERDNLEGLDIRGKILLKWIREIGWSSMD